jgi:hypothetical protein
MDTLEKMTTLYLKQNISREIKKKYIKDKSIINFIKVKKHSGMIGNEEVDMRTKRN